MEEVSNIKFYLFKSLRNRLINIANKKYKEKINFNSLVDNSEYLLSEVKETVEEKFISAEEDKKIKEIINTLLKQLSPRQQEIIYLRYYDYPQSFLMKN